MPKRHNYLFGNPESLPTTQVITASQLEAIVAHHPGGVTIQVLIPGHDAESSQAVPHSGYLFHIRPGRAGYELLAFTGEVATIFADIDALTRFVNHASGLQFNADSWRRSEELNRKIEIDTDTESTEEE